MKHRRTPFLSAVSALVFGAEAALVSRIARGELQTSSAILLHLAIVGALALWVCLSKFCRKDLGIPMLLLLTTCFMGPLGAAGTLITIALHGIYSRSAVPFEEWYASLFPETTVVNENQLWQRIILTRNKLDRSSVAPFSDILFFGTLSQKQELISLVSKHFQPAFAPILRMALNDSDNSIRVQAASAITIIEDDFLQRSVTLSESAGKDSRDPGLIFQLGRLNDEYARAGILDHERENECRQKAIEAYREYLRLKPDDETALIAIGKILLGEKKYEEAFEWLREATSRPSSSPDLRLLYMECLYNLSRYSELREFAAAHYDSISRDETAERPVIETLKLWAQVP